MSQATTAAPQMAVPKSPPEVLTLEEAAEYLRVSESEVVELATSHELPGRKIGEQWRFLKAALQDWLCGPDQRTVLQRHAGAMKDDPYLDEMLEQIYRDRGRPLVEK